MHPYFFPALQAAPAIYRKLVSLIQPDQWQHPTHPDRFSPIEVIAHQADWEPIFLERMQEAVRNPGGNIFGIDEVQRAIDMNYRDQDIAVQLDAFEEARTATIAWLRALTPEQFQLTVTHNEKGPLTIDEQANMLVGHDTYHTIQLLDIVRVN